MAMYIEQEPGQYDTVLLTPDRTFFTFDNTAYDTPSLLLDRDYYTFGVGAMDTQLLVFDRDYYTFSLFIPEGGTGGGGGGGTVKPKPTQYQLWPPAHYC